MAAIKLTAFQGIAPNTANHLLPDGMAQVATNCRLRSGNIDPLNEGEQTYYTNVAGTIKSIFRISEGANEAWLTWNNVVNCVKGPITGLGRYYYTGDGEPRATTYALASDGAGSDYPSLFRAMGLPAPVTAPTVTPDASGVGATVSRYYAYTFYDDWDQETPPSPLTSLLTGKVDDVWAVTGMDATPPNTGDITALTYSGSDVTITTTNTHFNRVGEHITIAGVTTVTNVNGSWELTAVNIASKTMTFTVTSAPSGTYVDGTDTADTWTRVAPFGACTKRLYRTSGSVSQFQLVAELISGTTYNDTLLDGDILGDELVSASWDMPPVDMIGLGVHPSGALIGFSGNELCFSEPYQPHAWPPEYRMRTGYDIVGAGVFGTSIGVATEGQPFIVTGAEPGQMTMDSFDAGYPCIAPRSFVITLTGVVYVSSMGLVQLDNSGAQLITQELYSARQWEDLAPATAVGAHASGVLYYAFTPTGSTTRMLVFGLTHNVVEIAATALYTDKQAGVLYYVVGSNVYAYDQPTAAFMSQDWMSKEYMLPEPVTMTAAKVYFDTAIPQEQIDALQVNYDAVTAANAALMAAGTVHGEINSAVVNNYEVNGSELEIPVDPSNSTAIVSFSLYVDGEFKYSTTVTDGKPFRLPTGYRGTRFAVRVGSTCRILAIELAENPIELKRA